MRNQKTRRGTGSKERRALSLVRNDVESVKAKLPSSGSGLAVRTLAVLRPVLEIQPPEELAAEHPLHDAISRIGLVGKEERLIVSCLSARIARRVRHDFPGSDFSLHEGITDVIKNTDSTLCLQLGSAAVFGNMHINGPKLVGYRFTGEDVDILNDEARALLSVYAPGRRHYLPHLSVATLPNLVRADEMVDWMNHNTPEGTTVTLGPPEQYNVAMNQRYTG